MLLFRLETTEPSTPALVPALQRHLAHAPLRMILAQIGERQQAYLALHGCAGCERLRCEPGCMVELTRRWLRSTCGGSLQRSKGLAQRPFSRLVFALPTPAVQPTLADLITPFPDARLIVDWQQSNDSRLMLALAATDVGPDVRQHLRQTGWRVWAMPTFAVHQGIQWLATSRQTMPWAGRWPHPPLLLSPQIEPTVQSLKIDIIELETCEAPQGDLATATANQLAAMLDNANDRQPMAQVKTRVSLVDEQPPSIWPHGVGTGKAHMAPADVEAFFTALIATPGVLEGSVDISRKQVAALLPERLKEHARALLCWMELAGLLAEQSTPRHIRFGTVSDPVAIAAALAACPPPTAEALANARTAQ